ncbi:twin-arginine translocase TatA/TatE family subunit [Deinococcus puniceus]|uniref:Sec-independent protein translocase protein TatA n=1 Tax=Deinococcus puniceus TaxID=1182568 RepID=A0A172T7T4_9DEIO|nr:twin-arginine translocase TatA/TatE family subunit [Deinococcus puniceus]ANE43004.1 Twin-arginine translocation protein [Deinococcus puniceus]
MPNIGPGEILVILLIALLVFGPRKLPELGKSLGAGIREFRKGTAGLKEEFEGSMRDPAQSVAPAPVQTIVASAVTPGVVMAKEVTPQSAVPQPAQAVTPTATEKAPEHV